MEIKSAPVYKEITEYVFVFNSGMEMSFVVDPEAGDAVKDAGDEIWITLAAKKGLSEDEDLLPAEHITILKAPLAIIRKLMRKVRKPSPEEAFATKQILHKLGKTVQ